MTYTMKNAAPEKGILSRIQEYLLTPCDPSNLAILRILFGLFMVIDIPQERGLSSLHSRWEEGMCYFPLFNVLQPLSVDWMHIVYLVMLAGASGIFLGFMFRISCILFIIPYWYVFWLDKGVWNNHSYLYGLFSIMLLMTDSNRYWSLDGLINPKIRNAEIPKWNYFLFRFQVFLVYFYAGIKKLDQDWMTGYSMTGLSKEWVFDPFRAFLSDETIDLVLVHICGLCFDLFVGFFLLFDKTRPIGILFALAFNGMNSQMFHIGMFSYTMMATLPLFCSPSWPKKLFSRMPSWLTFILPTTDAAQQSHHCLYEAAKDKQVNSKQASLQQLLMLTVFACYVAAQLFLPYSHFITKGYNGWTQGLYGYSWDMMVHSWSTQHVRIKVVDQVTGKEIFIKPGAFIGGGRRRHSRWNSHPDMIKQYVDCLAEKLKAREDLDISEPAIYLDIWRSMNRRFQQRFVNPNIDILHADWSPFQKTTWVQPLLMELSPWRSKLKEIEKKQSQSSLGNFTDVVFVADFPGLMLENFMSEELNTTLTVLEGKVEVEFDGRNHTLERDGEITVPSNATHVVYTVSKTPACWMYVYVNVTQLNNETIRDWIINPEKNPAYKLKAEWKNMNVAQKFKVWSFNKYMEFATSFWNSYYAVGHVAFGLKHPDEEISGDTDQLPQGAAGFGEQTADPVIPGSADSAPQTKHGVERDERGKQRQQFDKKTEL
ncbi:predicted protein [Nematostella vectensis]|uniref:Vitamin K-dependent gamma-carboxylase n=1 Tax=Nematostella vectensis TaxID=45351 RepID=A7SBF1_NEMVE|nr:predicted protein [Nematostella vectensis]|eukprot:XP_001631057.1 predicted protein [Nematostella vectensis]